MGHLVIGSCARENTLVDVQIVSESPGRLVVLGTNCGCSWSLSNLEYMEAMYERNNIV